MISSIQINCSEVNTKCEDRFSDHNNNINNMKIVESLVYDGYKLFLANGVVEP